jgi:hypothetical protein
MLLCFSHPSSLYILAVGDWSLMSCAARRAGRKEEPHIGLRYTIALRKKEHKDAARRKGPAVRVFKDTAIPLWACVESMHYPVRQSSQKLTRFLRPRNIT